MSDATGQESQADDFAFRPSKRRKFSRKRDDSANGGPKDQAVSDDGALQPKQAPDEDDEGREAEAVPAADLLRARKAQQQRRKGGIEFSATPPRFEQQQQQLALLTSRNGTPDVPNNPDPGGRFARQTGHKAEVDKHMIAYIDTEMAKRNTQMSTAAALLTPDHLTTSGVGDLGSGTGPGASKSSIGRGPSASTGVLQEVDLPARSGRSGGPGTGSNGASSSKKPERIRLGPDGKPWRGGRRHRRTSEDLKRDAMVESFLSEHALNQFDSPTAAAAAAGQKGSGADDRAAAGSDDDDAAGADAGDADERAAAEFRRRFRENAQERREIARAQPHKLKATNRGEIASGPKLGGSRSQRAKMHALEAEKEREKKAGRK